MPFDSTRTSTTGTSIGSPTICENPSLRMHVSCCMRCLQECAHGAWSVFHLWCASAPLCDKGFGLGRTGVFGQEPVLGR